MSSYSIKNLTRSNKMVMWSIIDNELNQTTDYCTNEAGKGIFEDKAPGWSANQVTGTGQFNLVGLSNSGMRYRIKKFFGIE